MTRDSIICDNLVLSQIECIPFILTGIFVTKTVRDVTNSYCTPSGQLKISSMVVTRVREGVLFSDVLIS